MIMTEILEEAAKNYAIDNSLIGYELMPYKGFIAGAKWQQEKSYSEEEVYKLLEKALVWKDNEDIGNLITAQKTIRYSNFNHWFEQFKKK